MRSHRIVSDSISYHSLLGRVQRKGCRTIRSTKAGWSLHRPCKKCVDGNSSKIVLLTRSALFLYVLRDVGGWGDCMEHAVKHAKLLRSKFSSMNLSSVLSSRERCGWPTAVAMLKSSQVDTVICNGILSVLAHADQWLVFLGALRRHVEFQKNRNVITSISVHSRPVKNEHVVDGLKAHFLKSPASRWKAM